MRDVVTREMDRLGTVPERYTKLGHSVGCLVDSKQRAYGDSFGRAGDVLRILYPRGIAPEQYSDALGVVRIVDKLFRIATDRDALGESPAQDIAGYGLLLMARHEEEKNGNDHRGCQGQTAGCAHRLNGATKPGLPARSVVHRGESQATSASVCTRAEDATGVPEGDRSER